jgi:hypothetical protein
MNGSAAGGRCNSQFGARDWRQTLRGSRAINAQADQIQAALHCRTAESKSKDGFEPITRTGMHFATSSLGRVILDAQLECFTESLPSD